MRLFYRLTIALCVFLAIASLTIGPVAALFPFIESPIIAEQQSDGYTYTFSSTYDNCSVYIWDLGDGTHSGGTILTHTYGTSGFKIVSLETDNNIDYTIINVGAIE